ncbi:hypothetical protein [Clostridium botulinum]
MIKQGFNSNIIPIYVTLEIIYKEEYLKDSSKKRINIFEHFNFRKYNG